MRRPRPKAKAALDNPAATQDELTAAWDTLLEGIWGLGLYQADKTNLGLLIEKAESLVAEQDKYVATNWQKLLDALAAAKTVMNNVTLWRRTWPQRLRNCWMLFICSCTRRTRPFLKT